MTLCLIISATETLIDACAKDQCVKDQCVKDQTKSSSVSILDHQRLVDKLIERDPDQSEEFYCSWMWEYVEMDMPSSEVEKLMSDNVIDLLITKGLGERDATRAVTKALHGFDSGDLSYHSIVEEAKLLTLTEWLALTVRLVRAHLSALDDVTLQRYYKMAELAYPEGYVPKPMPALKKGDKYK